MILIGCAGEARRIIHVNEPAADPYAVAPGDLAAFPAVTRIHVAQRRTWRDPERILAEVAALSTVVQVEHALGLSVVTGPVPAAEAVADYLVDRARFEQARIRLDVRRAALDPGELAFEGLTPCEGGLWAVVPEEQLARLVPARAPGSHLVLQDAEAAALTTADQRAYLSGVDLRREPSTGLLHRNPRIDVLTTQDRLRATGWLSSDADLLVLAWEQERSRSDWEGDARVWVRDEAGFTSLSVSLPRVHARRLAHRFVLRRGEALLLLEAATDAEEVQLTAVTWRPD